MSTVTSRHSVPTRAVLGLALGLLATNGWGQQEPGLAGPPPLIQYPNTPLRLILADYEVQSGLKLIKDSTILDLEVTVETVQPMETREEWLDYIERALLLNGIAFVPLGNGMAKVITYLTGAKQLSDIGINTYSDAADLPEGEIVVNYIMPLEFVSTEEATRIFEEFTQNTNTPYANITQVPDANVLIITENALILKDLIELKDKIDVRPGQVTTKVIQLERAYAETVAAAINDILTQQQEARSSTTSTRTAPRRTTPQQAGRAIPPPGTAAAGAVAATSSPSPTGTGESAAAQPIVVYPDIRTNRLLIIARPVDVAYIENMVKLLDAESDVKNFINRSLKHIAVDLVLPVLENALSLRADPAAATGGGGVGGAGGLAGQGRTTGLGGQGNFNTGQNRQGGFGGGQFGGGQFGGGAQFGGGVGGGAGVATGRIFGDQDTGPLSVLIGKTLVIADPTINNIIASGPPEDLLLINTILDEIDVKPRQVYISTVIGQVSLDDEINWGLDLLHRVKDFELGGENVRAGGLFQAGNLGQIDLDSLDVGTFPALNGLTLYGQIGDYVNAYLRALEQTNRFEMLSRPSIYIRNNRIGVISSGVATPVPTSQFNSTSTLGGSTQFDYRDITLTLSVQPLINSDDEVTLKIQQVNDTVGQDKLIGDLILPEIGRQELETEVTVPNKSTIVLGGLISEEKGDSKSGLPILVHVPLLKHLFSNTDISTRRRELLIFIQPHIIETAEDLMVANLEQTEANQVTEGALSFGRPEGLASTTGDPDAPVQRSFPTEAAGAGGGSGKAVQEKARQGRSPGGIFNPRNWRSPSR